MWQNILKMGQKGASLGQEAEKYLYDKIFFVRQIYLCAPNIKAVRNVTILSFPEKKLTILLRNKVLTIVTVPLSTLPLKHQTG